MMDAAHESDVYEDPERLRTLEFCGSHAPVDEVLRCLRQDCVVVITGVPEEQADVVVREVADRLGLRDRLELQAAFAEVRGHRRNIGQYFMSVNDRGDFQFIVPHSEGSSFADMQIAAFFCYENSTDG